MRLRYSLLVQSSVFVCSLVWNCSSCWIGSRRPLLNRSCQLPTSSCLVIFGKRIVCTNLSYPANRGREISPKALFLLPFPNHSELMDAHRWLFLSMNWLQDGAFKPYLTPSRNPIWRPENGKCFKISIHTISLLVGLLQLQIKSQRLPPHFRLCPTQTCQRSHCPTSTDIRKQKWQPRKPEVEYNSSYFHFRFCGRHFVFPMSDHVGSVLSESGMVENVG